MVRNQIPNILTLVNLLMGCISLYFIFTQQFNIVLWLLIIAGSADVFDGMIARWLGIQEGIGKQLDSLADVVSFGVVPGSILFQLIRYAYDAHNSLHMGSMSLNLAFGGFIFTLGAALRLARFNIDTRQTKEFIGLGFSGTTIAVVGLMLIHQKGTGAWYWFLMNPFILIGITIILAALMHAPIRMFSLKSFSTGWNTGNILAVVFLFLSIPAALLFKGPAVLLLPFIYVILSFIIYQKA